MSAKRSACDRCHGMKMQCQTGGHDQPCSRCQSARVQSNYSKPGKPGRPGRPGRPVRPPTKIGLTKTTQRSAADAEPISGAIALPNCPIADENWRQNTFLEHAALNGTEYFVGDQMALQHQYGCYSDTAYLQLDYTDSLDQLLWPLNSAESVVSISSMSSDHQSEHQGVPGEIGVATSPISKAKNVHFVEQDYIARLAHFQVTVTCMIDLGAHLGPTELEQEAAHVLESSSKFLELIQVLGNVAELPNSSHLPDSFSCPNHCTERDRSRETQDSSTVTTAVFLQVISISIRLIEMHNWLYSSIHRCLQQDSDPANQETAGGPPAQPLLFAIAGVRLTPTAHFRLQLLLHTGVYYLGRIQKILGEMEASSEVSPALPLQTRMLISGEQKSRMAKIRLVLAELKEKFGIHTTL